MSMFDEWKDVHQYLVCKLEKKKKISVSVNYGSLLHDNLNPFTNIWNIAHFEYFPFEIFYFSDKRFSNSGKSLLFGLFVVIEKFYYLKYHWNKTIKQNVMKIFIFDIIFSQINRFRQRV